MVFDLSQVPFSAFGSLLTFSVLPPDWNRPGVTLRNVRGVFGMRELFAIRLLVDGEERMPEIEATPACLRLRSGAAVAEFVFSAAETVRLRAKGCGVVLYSDPVTRAALLPVADRVWRLRMERTESHYLLTSKSGTVEWERLPPPSDGPRPKKNKPSPAPIRLVFSPGEEGVVEVALEEFVAQESHVGLEGTFDECLAKAEGWWADWFARTPGVPARFEAAARLARYVNASAVVRETGCLRRPTMLMSKNWMNQCWTWDHCFNAIAHAETEPDLAWDQWMVPFDFMQPSGALPDSVTPVHPTWMAAKPPIHGWALRWMERVGGPLPLDRAEIAYDLLSRWTRWWLECRDADGDGLPEYHDGCDSGLDNASVFLGDTAVSAPDLPSYLVLQMEMLADLAERLGHGAAAARWRAEAEAMMQRLLDHLWDGERFVSREAFTGKICDQGASQINLLPIILGERLPEPQRAALAEALRPGGAIVTRYGPATEEIDSPHFNEDGYWQGAIWPPTVMMIVDGLDRAGFREQALEVAENFCEMCRTQGMAENYSPITGQGQCDRAYTWGASVFLILASEFVRAAGGSESHVPPAAARALATH